MSHGARDVLVNNYSDLQTALDDVFGRLGVLEGNRGVRPSPSLTGRAAPAAVPGVSHSSGEILVAGFSNLQVVLDNVSTRLVDVESRVSGVSSPVLSGSVARDAVAGVSHTSAEIMVSNYSDLQGALNDILFRLTTLEVAFEPVNGRCGTGRNRCRAGTSNDVAYTDTRSYYNWRCDGLYGGRNSGQCSYARTTTRCGDGSCNGGETCSSCSRDCGRCTTNPPPPTVQPPPRTPTPPPPCDGDNICDPGETCSSCPNECSTCPVNGICGTNQNSCINGTKNVGAYEDSKTEYRWRCDGINGGTNSEMCTAPKSGEIMWGFLCFLSGVW